MGHRWSQAVLIGSLAVFASAAPAQSNYLSYFNIPRWDADAGKVIPSRTIQNKLLKYIDGALPGSEIRGHLAYIEIPAVTQALIDAKDRGVSVYLVQWGKQTKLNGGRFSPEGDELEREFGTRHKWCYEDVNNDGREDDGDLFSCVSLAPNSTHHIKNWLFSATVVDNVLRRYSSWVTSWNPTADDNGHFQDAFVINNDPEVYGAFERSFRHFYRQERSDDFYNVAGRGHHVVNSVGARTEISYSPHTKALGDIYPIDNGVYQLGNDHVAMALARIDAYKGEECSLKVAIFTIYRSRWAIIDQLKRIKGLGCSVQLAYGRTDEDPDVAPTAIAQLREVGIEVRIAEKPPLHSKMMVYKGRYDGIPGSTMVWGGSQNWNMPSLRRNDEVFVGITRKGINTRYNWYFDQIWVTTSESPH